MQLRSAHGLTPFDLAIISYNVARLLDFAVMYMVLDEFFRGYLHLLNGIVFSYLPICFFCTAIYVKTSVVTMEIFNSCFPSHTVVIHPVDRN